MARAGQGPGYIAIDFACTSHEQFYIMKGDWGAQSFNVYLTTSAAHSKIWSTDLTLKILLYILQGHHILPPISPFLWLQFYNFIYVVCPHHPVPINITPSSPAQFWPPPWRLPWLSLWEVNFSPFWLSCLFVPSIIIVVVYFIFCFYLSKSTPLLDHKLLENEAHVSFICRSLQYSVSCLAYSVCSIHDD